MQGLQPSVILAVALAWTATTGEAQIHEPVPGNELPPQNVVVAEHSVYRANLLSSSGMARKPVHISVPGASFIKVHFSKLSLPPGVFVEVSNPEGTETYRYTHYSRDGFTVDRQRGDDGLRSFSAMSISGDTAIVKIQGFLERFNAKVHGVEIDSVMNGSRESEPQQAVSQIEKALGSSNSKIETACGISERLDAACWSDNYPDQYDRAKAVAMLISPDGFQCTAWRVGSSNRLFTAEHCMPSQEALDATEIWFNFEAKVCSGSTNSKEVKVTGNQLLDTDKVLDYSLFTVNDFESITKFGNLGLDVRNGPVGENIFIPQHGRGDPKQISIESDVNQSGLCEIDDDSRDVYGNDTDIGYYCDTTSSSSGSPVISGVTGKVIALHHMGGCFNTGVKVSRIWPQVADFFDGVVPEGDSNANWAPSNELPEANYLANCDKLSCNFDAVESYDADGAISSYDWNFGDGSNSSGLFVDHEFPDQGEFDVSLTVEDDEGATDTYTTQVVVTKPNQAPSAKFSTACIENHCSFNGSGSEDPDGEIEQWSWNFGDGAQTTGQQAEHEFTDGGSHTITLTVADDEGAKGKTSHKVEVVMPNVAPQAEFSFACIEKSCTFDASGSRDSDGEITEYRWELGDGNSAKGMNFEYDYSQSGNFTVTLTVHDNRGKFNTSAQTVEVSGANLAPRARFTINCDDLKCSLDGSTSIDDDGKITRYHWLFGDGSSATGVWVEHEFPAEGSYMVELVVTDNEKAEGNRVQSISVEAPREIRLLANSSTLVKNSSANLKWSGAETATVRILRNGKHIADVANSGRYLDSSIKQLRKEARYQVCEAGSDLCSNEVVVKTKF